MIILIRPSDYNIHRQDLDCIYRLRFEVFYKKLQWDVLISENSEYDQYDEKNAYYLAYKDKQGLIRGCLRLIEMNHECMFDGPFRFLSLNLQPFKFSGAWEVSRFATDPNLGYGRTQVTIYLLAALYYFCLKIKRVDLFFAITCPAIARLYKQYGMTGDIVEKGEFKEQKLLVMAYKPLLFVYKTLLSQIPQSSLSSFIQDLKLRYK